MRLGIWATTTRTAVSTSARSMCAASVPRWMLAKARDEDRFGGMPDADPGNAADRWSRHRYGGFNPRCAIAERPASRVRRRSGSPRRLHERLPPGALARAAGEPQVVGPVHAEFCSGLVQGELHPARPLLDRVAQEPDLDPAEARLERNGPAERFSKRGEQLAVPCVIGLEQVQDDQRGHGRIVRGPAVRTPVADGFERFVRSW